MRLHQLDFTGVGPFLTPQRIDFDDLSVSGLFLIDGATGTGKTTIIDAIVYALFGDVSGGSDSDSGRMRSSYCTDTDPTGVTLEFTVDRRRHRIHRVPAGARDPREPGRAATSRPSRQVLTEFDADGQETLVLVKAGDIRQHVEALLAMNSEQFRQLVVLPQGRFADLLRMSPSERLTRAGIPAGPQRVLPSGAGRPQGRRDCGPRTSGGPPETRPTGRRSSWPVACAGTSRDWSRRPRSTSPTPRRATTTGSPPPMRPSPTSPPEPRRPRHSGRGRP